MAKGRVGTYVEIIGNYSNHGFGIGEIVEIRGLDVYATLRFHDVAWVCRGANSVEWFVCECDMIPAKAVVL